jgi:hypothetical protein
VLARPAAGCIELLTLDALALAAPATWMVLVTTGQIPAVVQALK